VFFASKAPISRTPDKPPPWPAGKTLAQSQLGTTLDPWKLLGELQGILVPFPCPEPFWRYWGSILHTAAYVSVELEVHLSGSSHPFSQQVVFALLLFLLGESMEGRSALHGKVNGSELDCLEEAL